MSGWHSSWRAIGAGILCVVLSGCTLSRPEYRSPDVAVGSPAFSRAVEAHTLSGAVPGNRVQLLLNGDEIFPAMIDAVRKARKTITFANFMYEDGTVARDFAAALAERCRAGVTAYVLLDAVGSKGMPREYRETLIGAGCRLEFYRPLNPLAIKRFNNRNHRRVLVVDGTVGFTGGVGIGDRWAGNGRQSGHWRQTDIRVEGPVVRFLQAAFAESWRDATGVLLGGDEFFPEPRPRGALAVRSIQSSPGTGATEAYMLYLLAIDGARSSIHLTNPYFVPDDGMAAALARAAQRGVNVSILTAGAVSTQLDRMLRVASRTHYAPALEAGVKIWEYEPAYLHAKTMVIDGQWVSVGSINVDNRSFALNSELNVALVDRPIAARLIDVFTEDLRYAERVTPDGLRGNILGRLFYLPLLPLRDQL